MSKLIGYLGEVFTAFVLSFFVYLVCLQDEKLVLKTLVYVGLTTVTLRCFQSTGTLGNPLLSACAYLMGQLSKTEMIINIVLEKIGGGLGYLASEYLITIQGTNDRCKAADKDTDKYVVGIMEFLLTSVMLLSWCAVWDKRNKSFSSTATLRIGLIHALCLLVGAKVSGSSFNPFLHMLPSFFVPDISSVLPRVAGQVAAIAFSVMFWKKILPQC